MILLPDGTDSFDAPWVAVGETYHHQCLDDDNGDTSYSSCTAPGREMIIDFANPSVAEADIDSITSVRFISSGRGAHRVLPGNATIDYEVPSGNNTQICVYDPSPSTYETISGISQLFSDGVGQTDWTYSDLESLQMKVTKSLSTTLYLSYLAMEVTYVAAAAADNATFFGANF